MKNLLVLTIEFYDRHGVKRKASKVNTADVTFAEDAEHWFHWACQSIDNEHGVLWDEDWIVLHWSLTPCGDPWTTH